MSARPGGAPGRWRRWRAAVLLVVLLVAVPLLGALATARDEPRRLDPASAAPEGARAVAEVLRGQGVAVRRAERVSAVRAALGPAGPRDGAGDGGAEGTGGTGATLVVTDAHLLAEEALTEVVALADEVVLLEPDADVLAAVAPSLELAGAPTGPLPEGPVDRPGCRDAAALAAGAVSGGGTPVRAAEGAGTGGAPAGRVQVCFGGAYASTEQDGRAVRVLAQSDVVTNAGLDEVGNAALALRVLGARGELVWLLASPLDGGAGDGDDEPLELLPGWVRPVALQLLLVAVAAVLWRARRLGALVEEPLPVVVRSVEVAHGRAALYRASRDRGAAAGALRAGALWRLGVRTGLPPGAPATDVVARAAAATGRDERELSHLLLGPVPDSDAALLALARALDDLAPGGATGAASATGADGPPGPPRPSTSTAGSRVTPAPTGRPAP